MLYPILAWEHRVKSGPDIVSPCLLCTHPHLCNCLSLCSQPQLPVTILPHVILPSPPTLLLHLSLHNHQPNTSTFTPLHSFQVSLRIGRPMCYEVNTRMKGKHTDQDQAGVSGNGVRTQFQQLALFHYRLKICQVSFLYKF